MSEILPPKPNEIERIVKSINVDVKVVKPAIEGEVVCEVSNSTHYQVSEEVVMAMNKLFPFIQVGVIFLENMFLNSLKDAKVKDKQLGP